jgi:uncharacterized protein YjbI with pentapeptide repeats
MKVFGIVRDGAADLFNGGVSKRFAALAVLLGLMLIAAVVFVVEIWPGLQIDGSGLSANEQLQRENDLRTTGLQALAGVVLALGAAFTAYSILSNREGQLDERFSRALDLLAGGNAHNVRGAAHSLERVAVQSAFDRAAVVQVLAGFIRDRTEAGPDRTDDEGQPPEQPPPPEVLEALAVLGRVKELPKSPVPHLQETRWVKGQLENVNLGSVLLDGCNFEGATLTYADLRRATLVRADLPGASLRWANLHAADLSYTDLEDVDLSGASLSAANLTGAILTGAYVDGETDLAGVDFTDAILHGFKIVGADLSRADVSNALVEGATYNAQAKFPPGFDPVERGMVLMA